MAVGATAVTAAMVAAVAAVAPASSLEALAVVEAAAEAIGAGLTACGPGVLITGAISSGTGIIIGLSTCTEGAGCDPHTVGIRVHLLDITG